MKSGKVRPAVRERSILRVLKQAKAGEGETGHSGNSGGTIAAPVTAVSSGTLGGRFDLSPEMTAAGAVNHVTAAGAYCDELQISLMLPRELPESELKETMRSLAEFAAAGNMRITGGDTTVSDAVNRPVLSVSTWGNRPFRNVPTEEEVQAPLYGVKKEQKPAHGGEQIQEQLQVLNRTRDGAKVQDLQAAVVMTGSAGAAGTAVLAAAHEEELRQRFPGSLTDAALKMDEHILCREAAEAAADCSIMIQNISRGGVFAALWELSERLQAAAGIGMEAALKSIPIRQETIEICEIYELNPYQLFDRGSLLIVTLQPELLQERLAERGIRSAVIGYTAKGRGCRIHNGEDVRYLEKPQQDALWLHGEECEKK